MPLLLCFALWLAAPADAATLTAKPSRWKGVDLACTSGVYVGPTTEAALAAGGVATLIAGAEGMRDQATWPAYWNAEKLDEGGFRVAPAATRRGPVDLAEGTGAGLAAAHAEQIVLGPKLRVDASGAFAGLLWWDGPKAAALVVGRLEHEGWNAANAHRDNPFLDAWALGRAEAEQADRWAMQVSGWIGREVGAAPFETPGPAGARVWTQSPSTGCGAKVKSCLALTVQAAQTLPPSGEETVPTFRREVVTSWVDPRSMQPYGWAVEQFSGQVQEGALVGEGRHITCEPAAR